MATVTVKYTLAVADLRPEFSNMSTDFKSNKKIYESVFYAFQCTYPTMFLAIFKLK